MLKITHSTVIQSMFDALTEDKQARVHSLAHHHCSPPLPAPKFYAGTGDDESSRRTVFA